MRGVQVQPATCASDHEGLRAGAPTPRFDVVLVDCNVCFAARLLKRPQCRAALDGSSRDGLARYKVHCAVWLAFYSKVWRLAWLCTWMARTVGALVWRQTRCRSITISIYVSNVITSLLMRVLRP